jgi:hypothetical protein
MLDKYSERGRNYPLFLETTILTKEVASELAKCTGRIHLHYVHTIDKDVATELVKTKGMIDL